MLIWLWTMKPFASSVSCWLANREGESTNMWNCKKGKFYYLEQILKTTETGKVLICESERSKQLKSESTKTSHSAQLQLNHQIMQSFSSTSSSETPMEWLARRKAAFGGLQGRLQGHHLVPGSTPKVNYRWQNCIENIWSCCCNGLNWHFPLLTGSRQRRGLG